MRRAFKIPTVRDEDFFYKNVECYAESLSCDDPYDLDIYHLILLEVHQTFCLPVIRGNPMSHFVKVNAN